MLGKASRLSISGHVARPSRRSLPKNGVAMHSRISLPSRGTIFKATADDRNSAPFLREYFENILEAYEKQVLGVTFPDMLKKDYAEKVEEQNRILREKCKNAITKSFNRHDTDHNGVLDKEEAKVFFSNVVAEDSRFQEAVNAVVLQAQLQKLATMAEDMTMEELQKLPQKEDIDATMAQVKANIAQMSENYQANKQERDEFAFQVCDAAGDGTLKLDEVVDAFSPGSGKFELLIDVLGMKPK